MIPPISPEMLKLAAEKGMESAALNPKAGDIPSFVDKKFSDVGSDVLRFEKDSNIPRFAENDADTSDGQAEAADSETSEGDDSTDTAGEQEANSDVNDGTQGDSANPEQQTDSDAEELLGLTDEEKARIKEETGWSDEIIDHIDSMEQYEIYKNADLEEREVNGRPCLCKKIDMDYVDPKTGMTNRQLMAKGRSPIDAKTGEKIELHHMGQDFNGPFVELCADSEHGDGNQKTLHPKNESWRRDEQKKTEYNNKQKPSHWKTRSEGE